jgi:hypothetical protein
MIPELEAVHIYYCIAAFLFLGILSSETLSDYQPLPCQYAPRTWATYRRGHLGTHQDGENRTLNKEICQNVLLYGEISHE